MPCHSEPVSDAPSSPSDVVRSYLASFDSGDPEAIAAHVASDFVNTHTSRLGTSSVGRAVYAERLVDFLASMPDLHYRIDSLVAEGPSVAVFYTMSGRWQGERPFEIRGAQHLTVSSGLITHRTDYWDSAVFLEQVGGP